MKKLQIKEYSEIHKQLKIACFSIFGHQRYRRLFRIQILYLQLYILQAGLKYGNLAVVAVLTGEDMSFDWQQNRPSGLDLASEGIVIVHIQYRTNIFGWLGQGTAEFPGNFGLADQELAFKWIQENIINFGGNPKQVSLLAHGTTGVTCGILHLINPNTNDLFSKLILMSGTPFTPQISTDNKLTTNLITKLGCEAEKPIQILNCLRSKSLRDLEKSFETIYRSGNFTKILGPALQHFDNKQSSNLWSILKSGEFRKIPIMFGLCSNEGAFMRDYWIDLAREGFDNLKSYIHFTILPQILNKYHLSNGGDTDQILKAINWKYFQLFKPDNPIYLLNSMQRFISEAEFEAPFFETIEILAKSLESNGSLQLPELYVYSFQTSQSMDMRGKINLFGGTAHSADLPLLMGPSLFQQIARRRLTPTEDKLCRRMRQLFTDFIKNGNPTPSRIYDAWLPYTTTKKYIKILGEFVQNLNEYPGSHIESNIHDIEELLFNTGQSGTGESTINREPQNPYDIRSTSGEIRRKNSYIVNRQDYEYYNHLKTVHSFWYGLLPTTYYNSQANETADREGRETVVLDELGECNKYKYAFF